MIDLKHVHELIEKETGSDFEIREYFDTRDNYILLET